MADADLLPQLLRQLTQKESAPPPDDNTQINKSIVPNDSMQMDDSNLTVTKYATSAFKWSGMPSVTQMVINSDFETVTGTATVFSDGLTSGAAWTTVQGTTPTYGGSGATSNSVNSRIVAGNSAWKPLTGSGGQNLALVNQVTFTTPASFSGTQYCELLFYVDSNNWYRFSIQTGGIYIQKTVGGTFALLKSGSQAISASTTYTMTISLDTLGNLTAKLYSGTGTSTPIGSPLTATDTSLSGGFLIGVGGDTGVVVSGAKVTAPMADAWSIYAPGNGAWALTKIRVVNGQYGMSVYTPSLSVGSAARTATVPAIAGATYTASVNFFLETNNTGGMYCYIECLDANSSRTGLSNNFSPTSNIFGQWQKVTGSFTAPTGTTQIRLLFPYLGAPGYLYNFSVDSIQLEQGSTATPYIRNDSTTQTITRPNAPYVAGGWKWNQGEYKPIASNKKVYPNDSMSMDDTNGVSVTVLNPSTFKWGGNGTKAGWKWNQGQYAQK